MNEKYPNLIARFYDVLYDEIRSGQDIEFYIDQIQESQGVVLEIGCGTGRLLRQARSQGANIRGIDNSEAMVDKLLEKDPSLTGLVEIADARDFKHQIRYALILAPFRVFSHLVLLEDQLQALRNIHEHLDEDGTFIFDLYVPDLSMLVKGIDNLIDFDGFWMAGKRLKRTISMKANFLDQVSLVTMRFDWEDDDGWKNQEWTFPMRYYFRYELEHLLNRSPFSSYKIYGDFNLNELNEASKEFIVMAKK